MPQRIGNDLCGEKLSEKSYGDRVFVFQVGAFQFSKFHKNVAKLDKDNFKRGLTVTFKVKNP